MPESTAPSPGSTAAFRVVEDALTAKIDEATETYDKYRAGHGPLLRRYMDDPRRDTGDSAPENERFGGHLLRAWLAQPESGGRVKASASWYNEGILFYLVEGRRGADSDFTVTVPTAFVDDYPSWAAEQDARIAEERQAADAEAASDGAARRAMYEQLRSEFEPAAGDA